MWISTDSRVDSAAADKATREIVENVLTAAIATSSTEGPWVFTAYVACEGHRFWFTSQESTRHVAELRLTPMIGLAMWSAPSAWGEPLVGLQLSGSASEVVAAADAKAGLSALHKKFPGTASTLPGPDAVIGNSRKTCLFMLDCNQGSIRDEAHLGKGRFPIVWRE